MPKWKVTLFEGLPKGGILYFYTWYLGLGVHTVATDGILLWQYGMWSFQAGGTKLERSLHKVHIF